MIINPWVIALGIGIVGMFILYMYALLIGVRVIRGWDGDSMEESQLLLERKSYLASTIVQYGFGVQILSLILFYMVLDSVAELIPGAMCATGSLKANAYGFPALFAKMAVAFVCFGWIVFNHIDTKLEDYPLTRLKYKSLLILAPLTIGELGFQYLYFVNLRPSVITSCCGVVFEVEGEGFGSSLASLAPGPMVKVFFIAGAFFLFWGCFRWRRNHQSGNYLFSLSSLSLFLVSILSIISFVSPYVYEMPSLHCPFNILRGEYHHIGYPLYLFLFTAALFSMAPGLTEPLKRKGNAVLRAVEIFQRRALKISVISWTLFFATSALPIVTFHLRAGGGQLFY